MKKEVDQFLKDTVKAQIKHLSREIMLPENAEIVKKEMQYFKYIKKQLKRKRALKVVKNEDIPKCPHCESYRIYDYEIDKENNFCPDCGRKLKWGLNNEKKD